MLKRVIGLVMVSAVILTGCSSTTDSAINLDPAAFKAKTQEAEVIVLDVRTTQEFNEGHIENAININVESDTFLSQIESLDKSKSYAVYCRSGRRSADALTKMANQNFTSLTNLNGGTIDWTNAGFALVTK
jgi:rhodanese-related sulfurtransferase